MVSSTAAFAESCVFTAKEVKESRRSQPFSGQHRRANRRAKAFNGDRQNEGRPPSDCPSTTIGRHCPGHCPPCHSVIRFPVLLPSSHRHLSRHLIIVHGSCSAAQHLLCMHSVRKNVSKQSQPQLATSKQLAPLMNVRLRGLECYLCTAYDFSIREHTPRV